MAIKWPELGDLSLYNSVKDIENRLNSIKPLKNESQNALTNWLFYNGIRKNDIVIARSGQSAILGYGRVVSDYVFDNEEVQYKSVRNVNWTEKQIETEKMPRQATLVKITDKPVLKRLIKLLDIPAEDTNSREDKGNLGTDKTQNLNLILYGPPGTGKTYKTIKLAACSVANKGEELSFDDAKQIFNDELHNHIEFITFHQNYSYEDFIQGLRPNTDIDGALSFKKSDGVFMRSCIHALFEYYKSSKTKNLQNGKHADPDDLYLSFVRELDERQNKVLKTKSNLDVVYTVNKNNNLILRHKSGYKDYTVSGKRLVKLYKDFPSIKVITNTNDDIRRSIRGCNTTCYWAVLNEFISYVNSYKSGEAKDPEQFEDIEYERKKELLGLADIKELQKVETKDVPKYVIIIDEINRANISRVFGELITLIEDDKRSHGEVPLSCTLPSGDEFIVPSNLYIIGTMNTADKSLALLDIALRRRFRFEPMYPLYEIEGTIVNNSDFLMKLNSLIVTEMGDKGYDHQIGHSYFMGKDFDLVDTMNNQVIPLLMEYFMNESKTVIRILEEAVKNQRLRINTITRPISISYVDE